MVTWSAFAAIESSDAWAKIVRSGELVLKQGDLIVYDHFLQIYKVAEKGYASAYLLDKGIKEASKSPRLVMFHEWLTDLKRYPSLPADELLATCGDLKKRLRTTTGIGRKLVLQRLNFCRQLSLQQMAPRVLADGALTLADVGFLKQFMPQLLHGKNQSDFIWLLQRLEQKPEVMQVISTLVTEEVVRRNKQVPRDILQTLVITPDLTRHIQQLGLDVESMRSIFYTEFSRLLEDLYRALETKKDLVPTKAKQLTTWVGLNLGRLPRNTALGRFSDLGKNLWRGGFEEEAIGVYELVAKNGNVDQREDALFFHLWIWANKGKWTEAHAWLRKQKTLADFDGLSDSRLKFWIAATLHHTDHRTEARGAFEALIRRHPLSYYAIMASKQLQAHYPTSEAPKIYRQLDDTDTPVINLSAVDPDILEAWRRLRAWARLDAKLFLNAELRGFEKTFIPNIARTAGDKNRKNATSDGVLITAALIGLEENYLESFRVLYRALERQEVNFNRFLLQILYPRPYYGELEKALKSSELDPLLLLSLIRQESVFNPEAKSRVGARGLMQLMPATAKRLSRTVRDNHLVVPKTNIEIGAKYFQQLTKRYQGNLVYVLSAYNAGESRVERWKGQHFDGDDMLRNIEMIPFLETRNYVKLIFRNLFFYKTLGASKDTFDTPTVTKIYDLDLGFKR